MSRYLRRELNEKTIEKARGNVENISAIGY